MNAIIKLESYSNGELMLREEYIGSFERKGRYLRYDYADGGSKTHMVVCLEDSGLYRLESKGERDLFMSCSDGVGKATLTLGAHSIDGELRDFNAIIKETEKGYSTTICYSLTFDQYQWTKTQLTIEAEKK